MKTWTFPSSSGSGQYRTTLADDGKLLCNCKGWTMRRGISPRHCKHTKQIAAELGAGVEQRGEFMHLRLSSGRVVADAVETPVAGDLLAPRNRQTGSRDRLPPAPMLASAMTTRVTGVQFDCTYDGTEWLMEEKLDGHRCTVVVAAGTVRAYSRPRTGAKSANARELPPHIAQELRGFPDGIYDGELVAPSGKAWDVVVVGARLVFVAFDLLALRGRDTTAMPYGARRGKLLEILSTALRKDQTAISTVESVPPSWYGVEQIWKHGGEGVILKRRFSTYRPGFRSPDWVKVKAAHAATLTIIGFEAGKSGACSALQLRDADGTITTVKTLGNALLRDVTAAPDSYIGRRVVISYQEKTPSGTYRHGIFDHFAGAGE